MLEQLPNTNLRQITTKVLLIHRSLRKKNDDPELLDILNKETERYKLERAMNPDGTMKKRDKNGKIIRKRKSKTLTLNQLAIKQENAFEDQEE